MIVVDIKKRYRGNRVRVTVITRTRSSIFYISLCNRSRDKRSRAEEVESKFQTWGGFFIFLIRFFFSSYLRYRWADYPAQV